MLGKVMAVVWAELGIQIENIKSDGESTVIYISVPETSYRKNAYGEELAGMILARRFMETIRDIGMDSTVIKSRVRSGEHWSEQMSGDAESAMRKTVYGNQI